MHNTVEAVIDLAALRSNLSVVRELCPKSKIMAMVKADGYGHGLLAVAKTLDTTDGLAVARLQEAIELRSAGLKKRILLTGTLLDASDLRLCSEQNIDVTLHDMETVSRAVEIARRSPLNVWLKIDSGMHRLGLQPEEFRKADAILRKVGGVKELIHMTHLSSADELNSPATDDQLGIFFDCHKINESAPISAANSAAILSREELRTDWVRPGIMLYGENPLLDSHHAALRPVMTLQAKVLAVRDVPVGESVGYGATWTSTRPSRIATIGIGYGDGYPRHAEQGTPLLINGKIAGLVGRVSMDSIAADVTDCGPVKPGDDTILWGVQLPASRIARCAKTITYELFTSLTPRARKVYINE